MNFVPVDSIAAHWPAVERGLLEVLRITKEKWSPTHVLQHLQEGWASLFVDEDGFCIVQRLKAPWTSEPYLNVWVMWMPGKAEGKQEALFDWLQELKAATKCEWVEMSSPREGWARVKRVNKVRTVWRIE